MIKYLLPDEWFRYDTVSVARALTEAKAFVQALQMSPYQRDWVEQLQNMQLKREVAGTSRIEGAEFTEHELEEALEKDPKSLLTRSQRQASAAVKAYRAIAEVPLDHPVDADLIKKIHRLIVEGADDDHCPPGVLRRSDSNVTFGSPVHRGAEGGEECQAAFRRLIESINGQGKGHDPLVLALAAHYHLAAIHPFEDGNGRTARALEALLLGRAGLRDICFIAMSNYYYEEKASYLKTLAEARERNHDLTPFLMFALKGIQLQSQKALIEIRTHIERALFKNVMHDLFGRLKSPKKRVIAKRQLRILELLLEEGVLNGDQLAEKTWPLYQGLKSPGKALRRDMINLHELGAVRASKSDVGGFRMKANLEWPTQISHTEFFRRLKTLPKSKTAAIPW